MYIITINYTASLTAIDEALEAHIQWLERHYQAGQFLVSGPQVPRTGGIIIANDETREDIERIVAQDPFSLQGLAEHTITQFAPTKTGPFVEVKVPK